MWSEALQWYERAYSMYLEQQKWGTFVASERGAMESVRKQIEVCRTEGDGIL